MRNRMLFFAVAIFLLCAPATFVAQIQSRSNVEFRSLIYLHSRVLGGGLYDN
jgi:hypothetical protein